MHFSMSKKAFIGVAVGAIVEAYDYALYALFLPIIAPLFFPAATIYQSFVKGYIILFFAMLSRPVGGILFGYLGDLFGRRHALLASMYGIAVATLIIGITPSSASIGIWAAVIITMAKAMQMFCFGGEYNGAGIYVVEHVQNKGEASAGSYLTAATLFGALLASLTGVICTLHFMPAWGWRAAFILGSLIGVFGVMYRKNLLESPNFKHASLKSHGLIKMIRQYPKEILAGVFIGGFAATPFATVLMFINPILMAHGYISSQQLMILQMLLVCIAVPTLVISGWIADTKSTSKVMRFSSLSLILFAYPLLYVIDHSNLFWIIVAEVIFIIITEALIGPSNAYLKNLFPMQYRYRGSSFSFGLGMSLIGGITPIVENYLYRAELRFDILSLWLVLVAAGAYFALRLVKTMPVE